MIESIDEYILEQSDSVRAVGTGAAVKFLDKGSSPLCMPVAK